MEKTNACDQTIAGGLFTTIGRDDSRVHTIRRLHRLPDEIDRHNYRATQGARRALHPSEGDQLCPIL